MNKEITLKWLKKNPINYRLIDWFKSQEISNNRSENIIKLLQEQKEYNLLDELLRALLVEIGLELYLLYCDEYNKYIDDEDCILLENVEKAVKFGCNLLKEKKDEYNIINKKTNNKNMVRRK